MGKGKDPQTPDPVAATAADMPDDAETFDINEVVQDLSQQVASLSVELAARNSIIRKLRRELVAKSQAGATEG